MSVFSTSLRLSSHVPPCIYIITRYQQVSVIISLVDLELLIRSFEDHLGLGSCLRNLITEIMKSILRFKIAIS